MTIPAKVVQVPLFRLSDLTKDATEKAFQNWRANKKVDDGKAFEGIKEFLDYIYEALGLVLYDIHCENCYIPDEYDGDSADAIPLEDLIEYITDNGKTQWALIPMNFDPFKSFKHDTKEEIAEYFNDIIKSEYRGFQADDDYFKTWQSAIQEKYQAALKSLQEADLGTEQHYDAMIKAMKDAFDVVFNRFVCDLKSEQSQAAFESQMGDSPVFLKNGDIFDYDPSCFEDTKQAI